VLDGVETLDGPAGDALRRRIARDQVGVLLLETLELVQEAIELFVGDLGRVVYVVLLFVMADGDTKRGDAVLRRLARHG
jgi:hypothetical protein